MTTTPAPAPPCTCGHPRHTHVRLSGLWAHCKYGAGSDLSQCRRCGRYTPITGIAMHQRDTPNGLRWRVDCDHCDWTSEDQPRAGAATRMGRDHLTTHTHA